MRYMFLIYCRETEIAERTPAELESVKLRHRAVMEEAKQKGVFLAADPLQPTTTSTTVRVRDSKPLIVDGPFAETKEQLAGYYMLECKDLDEALYWGAKIPTDCRGAEGCIEIRPIREMPR
jgi:hypothetical protein